MPASGPSAAAWSRPLTSSAVVGRATSKTQSVSEALSRRHPDREAVEPPLQLGKDQADRSRRPRRRRDERERGRPSASQVLVRRVDQRLRVGHVVQRRDGPVPDADALVDHLDDRREAIGRARRGGEHVVPFGVVAVVVDPDHHVERVPLDGRSDDHLSHARAEVRLERLARTEPPAALEHDLHSELAPRHAAGLAAAAVADGLSVDHECIAGAGDLVRPAPVHRVERQEVRGGVGVAVELVDVRESELGPVPRGAQRHAADATEAVDADARAGPFVRSDARHVRSIAITSTYVG